MKLTADKKRTDYQFAVGDQVLLKLQPYTQSSVANRPYPKLAYKYFGPYTVIQKVGTVAYRLQLPDDAQIHDVFHVSQLKPYTPDYTPIYDSLPVLSDLEATKATPLEIRAQGGEEGQHCCAPSQAPVDGSATVVNDLGRLLRRQAPLPGRTSLGTSCISGGGRCHAWTCTRRSDTGVERRQHSQLSALAHLRFPFMYDM